MIPVYLHKADEIFKINVFVFKKKVTDKMQDEVMDKLWDPLMSNHTAQIRIKIKKEYENN